MSSYAAGEIARVYLLDVPYSIDHAYDYYIPSDLRASVSPGHFVTVPFGNGNRKQIAVTVSLPDSTDFDTLKPVAGLCSDAFTLDGEMLSLCAYIKDQTLCTMGDALRCMIPSAALSKLVDYYRPIDDANNSSAGVLTPVELFVLEYIKSRRYVSSDSLRAKFGTGVTATIDKFCSAGIIERELEIKAASDAPSVNVYSVALPQADAALLSDGKMCGELKLTSAKQKAVVGLLLTSEKPLTADEISEACGAGKTTIKSLCNKQILKCEKKPVNADTCREYIPDTSVASEVAELVLNDEQTAAYEKLAELSRSGKPEAALLHGVTGSGKTCVMLRLIDDVLASGRSVIVLLPEIALTPQSLGIFCGRYKDTVAVIHSALSAGERMDSYRRIHKGDARVIVGTRSAVFSPAVKPGLIIIDEEQEHTYKSDRDPKYHARDIARWRCAHNSALMLLASATPSLESYMRASEGRYTLIKLKNRYGRATLPDVTVADMRGEAQGGNTTPIGTGLARELTEVFARHEQSVLFLNRRGYNHLVSCRSCGEAITCPRCSVAMNYHTRSGTYSEGDLVCHWCGTKMPVPVKCPSCGSPHLVHMGYGTQRVEQELSQLLPDARILRMDADSTTEKFSHDRILGQFRRHEADVLLGTQMVTKGHDFPDVTLVGVLLADASLYLDDYRANEQTFALLTQVIGRAGRGKLRGHAIIQTNNPDNDIIKLACAQDYETFYQRDINLRRLLVFPPLCDIAMITLTSSDEKELLMVSTRLAGELSNIASVGFSDVATVVFGPFEAPVYRVDSKYRMRFIIKCRLNRRSREMFSYLLVRFGKESGKYSVSMDFNPSSLS